MTSSWRRRGEFCSDYRLLQNAKFNDQQIGFILCQRTEFLTGAHGDGKRTNNNLGFSHLIAVNIINEYISICTSQPACHATIIDINNSIYYTDSPASKFPWTYDSAESCYLLEGQVTVTPTDGRKAATFGKGDFVTFPSGMSCTWDVTEAVQKHFMFF